MYIKIPGTPEGLVAIEECTFAGLPINVTLLFSAEQYQAAAEAFLRGVERRVRAGLNPAVSSVSSVFVSRWDKAVADRVPRELRDRLGTAVAARAYRGLPEGARLRPMGPLGERRGPSRSACCGQAPRQRTRRVRAAVRDRPGRPFTINTMPEATLLAFADHGQVGTLMAPTAATPRRPWQPSPRPAWNTRPWPASSSGKGRRPSTGRGRVCWRASRPNPSSWRQAGANVEPAPG